MVYRERDHRATGEGSGATRQVANTPAPGAVRRGVGRGVLGCALDLESGTTHTAAGIRSAPRTRRRATPTRTRDIPKPSQGVDDIAPATEEDARLWPVSLAARHVALCSRRCCSGRAVAPDADKNLMFLWRQLLKQSRTRGSPSPVCAGGLRLVGTRRCPALGRIYECGYG